MRFITAGALALSALTAFPALADDGGKEVDETRVMDTIAVHGTYLSNEKFSGTKTQTPIVDVPQSLSVVTSDQIAEQAFRSQYAARTRRQTFLSMACVTMCSTSGHCIMSNRSKSCADQMR